MAKPAPSPEVSTPAERPRVRGRGLWILLGFAVLLRCVVLADLAAHDPLTLELHSDARVYDQQARAAASGEPIDADRPYWRAPLYPWILSRLYSAGLDSVGAVIVVQALLGVLTTWLAVLLCARTTGRTEPRGSRIALAAGWAWTLYYPVVYYESRLLAVSVVLPLCLGALLLLTSAEERLARGGRAGGVSFGAGLVGGIAAMARPNLLLAIPFAAAAWLVIARMRRERTAPRFAACATAACGLLLGLLPTAIHNARATDRLLFLDAPAVATNGGLNFWFGNNPDAHGTFHAPGPEWGAVERQRDVAVATAVQAAGRPVDDVDASAYWFARGRSWIVAEPLAAARLWGLKLLDTLSSTEFGIVSNPALSRAAAPSGWAAFVPFGLLPALAVLGWRGSAPGRTTLLAWLLAGLVSSLAFFTYSRFRLPILVALLPFVGRGALRLLEALRGRERLSKSAVVVAALLLAQSFFPFEGAYPDQLRSNALVDEGIAWWRKERLDSAEDSLRRAIALVPANARARVELARLQRFRGDERAAYDSLQEARRLGIRYPEAEYELAKLRLGARDERLRDPVHGVQLARSLVEETPAASSRAIDYQLLLAAALVDHPELQTNRREARMLLERIRNASLEHPQATALLRRLDGLE